MRTIIAGQILPAQSPYYIPRSYALLSDNTIWLSTVRDGDFWKQLPNPGTGSTVITLICAAHDAETNCDVLVAGGADGSVWYTQFYDIYNDPIYWMQITKVPQP